MTRDFSRRPLTLDTRLATVGLVSVLFITCFQSEPPSVPKSPFRVVILHTADLHGQVDRLPSLASFIESERRKSEVSGVRVLHVDSGDFFQGTPEGDLTRGRAVLEALNAMRCDALVPGNHDFDFGPGVTEELAGAARFPFLAANLRRSGGRGPPPWVRPSLHRPELRLELVGLVTSEMEKLSSRRAREGLEFAPEAGALAAHAWAP
ncbi:MAG TPA: metallophosphoesterase, partial [Planctomycetota bacterium]